MATLPKLGSTKDVRSSFATILAYAVPRFGKTNTIRTLLDHGFKPLILATDQGDSMGLQTISDVDIPYIHIPDWDTALMVFAELGRARDKVKYQGQEFDVIVNDSISGFGQIWMDKGLNVLGWDEIGIAERGKDPRQLYAYIPEKGRQTTKWLMNLPAHLILLARETLAEEGQGNARITYPAPELPGAKLPRELPGWLDAVIFGKIMSGKRVFMTEAEGKIIAGIRSGANHRFPKYIKNDYGLLIKAMMGDLQALKACNAASSETSATQPQVQSTKA